jgi:glucosamine-6-phosphate deaminase
MPVPVRVLELAGASVQVFASAAAASREAAERIAATIRQAVEDRGKAVLGLATGGSPVEVYARLVALHKSGELSFAEVTSYNLDEYYPIHPSDPNSYRAYMHRHLFGHVNIAPNRAHVLDGTVPEAHAASHATEFDRWIAADGGLDLQLLGIGRNGHIGFNEPSDLTLDQALTLPTRLVNLDPMTRADAAGDFDGEEKVIPRALTVGVAPILDARAILLLALGSNKAEAVARALNGPMTARLPASLLQAAPGRVTWLLDEAAAQGLGSDD